MFVKDDCSCLMMMEEEHRSALPDIVLHTQRATVTPLGTLRAPDGMLHIPLVVSLPDPVKSCNRSCSSDSADSGFSEVSQHKLQPRSKSAPSCRCHNLCTCTVRRGECRGGGRAKRNAKSKRHRDSQEDEKTLGQSLDKLKMSGFYYPDMTMVEAKQKLRKCEVGTFLIRDSSHPGFLFSLSTKTHRGTTSVRVEYAAGSFKLDSEEDLQSKMPKFDCVMRLIEFYVKLSNKDNNKCVWLESSGRKDTPVVLAKPYIEHILPLKHMCRKTVHDHVDKPALASLPTVDEQSLSYLQQYPHSV